MGRAGGGGLLTFFFENEGLLERGSYTALEWGSLIEDLW